MRIRPLLSMRYLIGRDVRTSLFAAIEILHAQHNQSMRLDLESWRCLGRFRSSVIFCSVKSINAPKSSGLVIIKVPVSRSRACHWDAIDELHRLHELAAHGPKDGPFDYITPFNASNAPPFIITSYYPSNSLRSMIGDAIPAKKSLPNEKLIDALACSGQWLGKFNWSSTHASDQALMRQIDELFARLRELETYAAGTVFTANAKALLSEILSDNDQVRRDMTYPISLHGDFVPDNILYSPTGRICIIDPEPIFTRPYSDFIRFREFLIILTRSRYKIPESSANQYATAFSRSYRKCYPHYHQAGWGLFKHVVYRLSHYHKNQQPLPKLSLNKLVYWNDQRLLMAHWGNWLTHIPKKPKDLWGYIEKAL